MLKNSHAHELMFIYKTLRSCRLNILHWCVPMAKQEIKPNLKSQKLLPKPVNSWPAKGSKQLFLY